MKMSYLYIVRCNFTRSELERSWNRWYNEDKVPQLLAKPMFRAVQRFQLHAGNGRSYIAVWQVTSPDAFKTPQYTSDWGFFEWERHVTDWSRDLFDAGSIPETDLAIAMNGFLRVISFDGLDAADAEARRAALVGAADVMWFKAVGLDRHTPMIGLQRESNATEAPSAPASGIQAGIYRPIWPFTRAAASAKSAPA